MERNLPCVECGHPVGDQSRPNANDAFVVRGDSSQLETSNHWSDEIAAGRTRPNPFEIKSPGFRRSSTLRKLRPGMDLVFDRLASTAIERATPIPKINHTIVPSATLFCRSITSKPS
jgi:hypothetical protein